VSIRKKSVKVELGPSEWPTSETHVTLRSISQLLTELGVLEVLTNIIVVTATNRPNIIDAFLLRLGRFDRVLYVPTPDQDLRIQTIKNYPNKKSLASDI
jgi:transitional endoplasmic reticulum ATPase